MSGSGRGLCKPTIEIWQGGASLLYNAELAKMLDDMYGENDHLKRLSAKSFIEINAAFNKPRNPDRIPQFLTEVGSEWRKLPDWRFGQLMFNFFHECGDPFHFEEDKFLEELKKYVSKRTSNRKTAKNHENE